MPAENPSNQNNLIPTNSPPASSNSASSNSRRGDLIPRFFINIPPITSSHVRFSVDHEFHQSPQRHSPSTGNNTPVSHFGHSTHRPFNPLSN